MNLRQSRAIANFVSDIAEYGQKMVVHEEHLREAGLPELAELSRIIRQQASALLEKWSKMARGT